METKTADDQFVILGRLRGHKGQVLCAAAPEPKAGEPLVATGAEDSTVRLWDLRDGAAAGSSRVALCLCRCFGGESVTSVVFGAGDASRLYCSAGGKVMEFDLRSGGGLLLTSPSAVLDDEMEEVNELAMHPKGEYLAAADDSGRVRVYNTRTRMVHKTLRNAHTSICHTVRFRPRASWDLASGALDSTLVFWDFSTGRIRRKLNLVDDGGFSPSSTSSRSTTQLFNPPFVHSVDFTVDGRFLAAGLGDSTVVVLDAKTRMPVGRCDAHSAPISQVHYPSFDSRLLVSSGNDQRLLVWDHQPFEQVGSSGDSSTVADGGEGTRHSLPHSQAARYEAGRSAVSKNRKSQHGGKKKSRADRPSVSFRDGGDRARGTMTRNDVGGERQEGGGHEANIRRGNDGGGAQDEVGDSGRIVECSVPLSAVRLEEKPNWITSVSIPYQAIVVADTSSEVKIMRIPDT